MENKTRRKEKIKYSCRYKNINVICLVHIDQTKNEGTMKTNMSYLRKGIRKTANFRFCEQQMKAERLKEQDKMCEKDRSITTGRRKNQGRKR
jgi:hypothetical protein